MFRIENYITPILWSYFSKYVKNFNPVDFQLSLWNGGASFSNLDLNLEVLDSELQIPLHFSSGHIQELKISVPWRKITSEPVVLNVKSMELVLKYRDLEDSQGNRRVQPRYLTDPDKNDENAGYVRSLMSKIIYNIRVNFENVVIKYIESDIAFSVNVGEASLTPADCNWNDYFIERILYAPDFILRKKLSFSDVNICLDRCNNAGLVDKFHDPMLYRCDFDVRIIQKFATSFSRIPYYYRMDLFMGHLQFNVTDEQVPMLARLYNLFSWLMQNGGNVNQPSLELELDETASEPPPVEDDFFELCNSSANLDVEGQAVDADKSTEEALGDDNSWTSWAGWLFEFPSVFGEEDSPEAENTEITNPSPPTPPPFPITEHKALEGLKFPPPTTHFGVYINTLTVIFKAVQRSGDRPVLRRKIINMFPFLKCSIQGVSCNFIVRANVNSHAFGVSSIMVHGLGFCPCGVQDCTSSEGGSSSQGGECYFEAGTIKQSYLDESLFQPITETESSDWNYDTDHKTYLNYDSETVFLEKTPAFFLKGIITTSADNGIIGSNVNDLKFQSPVITEILYHGVAAPCKVLICSGLTHRLKMVNEAINNYGYEPYGAQGCLNNIPNDRYFEFFESNCPTTSYRLVIRQPLIEIMAADHPSDYSPEKRAEYFKKSGGVISATSLPRLSPEWPKMVISCDIMEVTAEDSDGHFARLRDRFLEDPSAEVNKLKHKRRDTLHGAELIKWIEAKKLRTANIHFGIREVLVTFISEPVELNIGIKSGAINIDFSNYHFYTCVEFVHRVTGDVRMETVTCSTRLERRSNVLWMPFSIYMKSILDWETGLPQPSLGLKINMNSLTMYVGPETIIAFSQLAEKLLVYLQEFLPHYAVRATQTQDLSRNNRVSFFTSNFKTEPISKLQRIPEYLDIELPEVGTVGVCVETRSVIWRFPQRRTIRMVNIDSIPTTSNEAYLEQDVKFELEYLQEVTGQFYHFHSFFVTEGRGKVLRFLNDPQQNCIAASIWRIRIIPDKERIYLFSLESVSKSLIVESVLYPELKISMYLPEVFINLVNNTFYAGKALNNPILKSYAATEGVSPADHVLACVHLQNSSLCYNLIQNITRSTADFTVDVRVLDYETLALEQVVDPVFIGAVMTIPDTHANCILNVITKDVSVKIGASLVHSLMYSASLWNQIIHSFDSVACKMISTENRPKIILNRVLICNDLNFEIEVRFIRGSAAAVCKTSIASKDCKALSCPEGAIYDIFSKEWDSYVEIDLNKSGYTAWSHGENSVFTNVSNLSASQKLVKISGALIIANGLDQDIESSIQFSEKSTMDVVSVSSRGVGPTNFSSLNNVEYLRFRLASTTEQNNPWSDSVYTIDLKERFSQPVFSVFLSLFKIDGPSVSKIQVWLSIVSENIDGLVRNLIVVSPIYCLRSWLSGGTLIYVKSVDENSSDLYKIKGKGDEVEIIFNGERDETRHMKFQSSPDVTPSLGSVPLLPAGPLMEHNTQAKPIDDLLAQITGTSALATTTADEAKDLKWPFVNEEMTVGEWNTEINPETEIMVSFTPWIEGLPTAVADIRPWALFVNLSGVELLFAQESDPEDWIQFWIPHKCVFSPKRIAIPTGKFRLGIMMEDFLVKSPSLQFSDQQERFSVKKINKDGKVPIDCYSRLDLFGGIQVACLTIETRVRNMILVMTVRPTYTIQNRTPGQIFAEGLTISSPVTQRRELWPDDKMVNYSTIEACADPDNQDCTSTAVPILHFTADGLDYSSETPSYKYLGLSCGGPWWFVQLVDCSELSTDGTRAQGIPGTKIAVTLPRVDCTILSRWYRHRLRSFKRASEPVVVGCFTKNGQVWVSVSQDYAPQLKIHNKSSLPLFFAEKEAARSKPRHMTPYFEQYLMVPPKSTSHFSFISAYNGFPQLNKKEVLMPDVMLASVSQDLVDFVTAADSQIYSTLVERSRELMYSTGNKAPAGNLLFPNFDIEWQASFNVHNSPTQYVNFGEKSVKISVEIVAYTYHVFIENVKLKEVKADTIRSRFAVPRVMRPDGLEDRPMPPPQLISGHGSTGSVKSSGSEGGSCVTPSDSTNGRTSRNKDVTLLDNSDDDAPPSPRDLQDEIAPPRPWRVKIYIPEFYLSIQDNFRGSGKEEREFLALAFESILVEQFPIIEHSRLRPNDCPRRESWIYTLQVGNLQIDTPEMDTHSLCEFPVLLQPKVRCTKSNKEIPTSAFGVPHFLEKFYAPKIHNIDSTITLTRVGPTEINLETAWLRVLPLSVFVEDRLLSYVIPSVQAILDVLNDGYSVLERTAFAEVTRVPEETNAVDVDPNLITQISIVDASCPPPNPVLFYSGGHHQRKSSRTEMQTIFSRNITFTPTLASSSSGLNSSNSSIVSSTLSNLRLASLSPLPPSPLTPLEPHGSSQRAVVQWPEFSIRPQTGRKDEPKEDIDVLAVKKVKVPKELIKLFQQLSRPVRLKTIEIQATEVELSLHTDKLVYVALDRSQVQLGGFRAYNCFTTDFHLGLELTMHYTVGTIFTIGNPVRVLGSLELLGSPGTLARTVGTGLRDLVVYPYEGILNGPVGFVSGLGYGVASLAKSVTSGSLVSLTNWANSVSKNIDRLTLDQQEQLISEAARQVELQGFTDGFVMGLSGFGIRVLGAIGGITHQPIQSVMQQGPSTRSVLGGVSRGVIGAVVKPIGGIAELIAMTGQGILLGTGWKPRPKVKKPKQKKKAANGKD